MIKNCLWNFLVNQVTISAAHYTNAKTLKPSGASGHFAAPSKTDKRQSPCPYFENSAAAKTSVLPLSVPSVLYRVSQLDLFMVIFDRSILFVCYMALIQSLSDDL